MLNIVWIPWTCIWNEDETQVTLEEQAADPDVGANDPRANGPFRTTLYDAITFELLEQKWLYREVTWTAPADDEQAAIDAWQLWATEHPPPDPEEEEEPPPEEPEPEEQEEP